MDTHVDHGDDQIHSSATKQLLARVQDLEARNRELISEATLHSSRIQALRVSHGQLIDSMKESHAIEVDALRKQEWPAVVKGKEKELELLRNNNDGFKNRIQVLEARVRERDEEVNWMKEKLEKLERGGKEQEVAGMDVPEISRKLVDEMRRRKTAEQSAEDLMDMVTKITGRLAEEKTKNAALESNMSRITEDSWMRVSDSKHEIQKLRHSLEDREELLQNLQVEMNVVKRERAEYREAWEREQTEHSSCQQTIEDREERIRDLEFESGDLRDRLELSQAQLEQLQKQSDVHEDILVKLVESSSSSSRCSHRDERAATPSVNENTEELRATIEKLQHDIKLYRSDIRAYRRDVKTRDKTIQELQSQLSTPVTPRTIREDFPAPPNRLREENDNLHRELENRIAVTKQQTLVMKDMEAKMKALRREKEQMEARQLRQLKLRMEQQPQKPTGDGYIIIGNDGEDAVRPRRTPSGRRRKEVVDLDIPPPNSPLPPPPPPRKDSVGPRTPGDDENEGETFVW
jgi:chromosome segregation ATPase